MIKRKENSSPATIPNPAQTPAAKDKRAATWAKKEEKDSVKREIAKAQKERVEKFTVYERMNAGGKLHREGGSLAVAAHGEKEVRVGTKIAMGKMHGLEDLAPKPQES
eukprot:gene880-2049_t